MGFYTARTCLLLCAICWGVSPARAQDDLSSWDDLDSLDEELGDLEEGSAESKPWPIEFKGFLAEEIRTYPLDRGGDKNDEQLISEVQVEFDWAIARGLSLEMTPWFYVDVLDTELLRYEPLEAYLIYRADNWDLLAGQFIESWGIADTSNPLDVLNRRDLAIDLFNPQVRGELGVRMRWTLPGSDTIGEPSFGVYVIPLWRETQFPTDTQRFGFSSATTRFRADLAQGPEDIDRMMMAIRFDHTLSTKLFSADMQYLVARGPDRAPLVDILPDETSGVVELIPHYYGFWVLGGGLRAVPQAEGWSKFTFKLEAAYKRPYAFYPLSGQGGPLATGPSPIPGPYAQIVVGFDRNFAQVFSEKDEVIFTTEFAAEIGPNDAGSVLRPFDHDAAIRLAWSAGDFARSSLELRGVVDVVNGEIISEFIAERQLRFLHDDLKLRLRARALIPSPKEGEITLLSGFVLNNSSVSARLQFDF